MNNNLLPFLGNAGGPLPNWAEVEGCNESECVVVNNQPLTLSAELPVIVGASSLTTRVTASWSIINTELELPADVINGCNAFPNGCPLVTGNTETLSSTFVVTAAFSNITPTIEFIMTNEAGERVVCVRTDIRVVDA